METLTTTDEQDAVRRVLSKVPEITIFFWIIKILCTTIGETAADFLNVNLNLGLTITSIIVGVLFIVALFTQFKTKKYTPGVYWITVLLISVFGTLVTDNVTDSLQVPLEYSTIFFTVVLAGIFALWYAKEKTLSIHSIFTRRREAFYWLAILFTFALGTAAGDLMAEGLGLGYATTGIIIATLIAIFYFAKKLGLNAILSFWFIYILTRPLGASIGDFLTQSPSVGGIGLGATTTTLIFSVGIIASVAFLALSQKDVVKDPVAEESDDRAKAKGAFMQLVVVVALLLIATIGGYFYQQHQLQTTATNSTSPATASDSQHEPLGDLTNFTNITQAMLAAVNAGDWSTANKRANDIEYAWDTGEARLKPMNRSAWTNVDDAIDKVLREVRAVHPNQQTATAAIQDLLTTIQNP